VPRLALILDSEPRQAPRIERLASRSVRDAHGVPWLVQEVRDLEYDRRATTSLIFSSDDVMRRVRVYPPNWIDLPDDELIALSFGV
jgi:hypothetical protein